MQLFDVPQEWVVAGTSCTWCEAEAGAVCAEPIGLRDWTALDIPHAQRWRDYWNATHRDKIPVYRAPWRRGFREPRPQEPVCHSGI